MNLLGRHVKRVWFKFATALVFVESFNVQALGGADFPDRPITGWMPENIYDAFDSIVIAQLGPDSIA